MEYDRSLIEHSIMPDGSLADISWYLNWNPERDFAILDGPFTADDLIAIGCYMREHKTLVS